MILNVNDRHNFTTFVFLSLYKHTSCYWDFCGEEKQTVCVDDKYVVFEKMGEFICIICGVDYTDELICECNRMMVYNF